MKKQYFLILALFGFLITTKAQTFITVYDNVLFYDGYAGLVSNPTAPNVVRLRNDLFTKKLTLNELSQIGNTLELSVLITAACDNYDRIGNVNLALVPKYSLSYNPATTSRIELGRFITPFMNKNIQPTSVPYSFIVDNVTKILKDSYLNSIYDFWIELEVFGVPYAANTQVAGCAGRNDVFFGTLDLITDGATTVPNDTFILPLNFKKDLNNYAVGASDYVTKPIHWAVLRQRVRRLLDQANLRHQIEAANQQLAVVVKELQRLVTIDGLTQVANRRCLDEYLDQECKRSQREQIPISLVLCLSLIHI